MIEEQPFMNMIASQPHDWAPRLVFADWLEERGDPRGELLRLLHELLQPQEPRAHRRKRARLQELVAAGTPAPGPFHVNEVGITFALIPPGTFWMGGTSSPQGDGDEY